MKREIKIYLILIVIVILVITGIYIIKGYNSERLTESSAKCISEKSIMYSQKSCSHCLEQKKILGDYLSMFNIIECDDNPEKCLGAGITGTPTWIINGEKAEGVQSIKKLKELSGC